MRITLLRGLLAATLMAAGAAAQAQTATQTFGVRLVVQENCTIGATPTDVDFGTQTRSTGTGNVDTTGSISVTCSAGTPYSIALNGGLDPDGTSRGMLSGSNRAPYQLYQNAARTLLWGDGTTFGTVLGGTGTGAAQTVTIYGRLTSLNFPAGTYADTVTATVTY